MPEEFDVNARDIENAEMKETVVDKEDEGNSRGYRKCLGRNRKYG